MQEEPRPEHLWLEKLLGRWTSENECVMGPDQPPMKLSGSFSFRSLGGLWVIGEGQGEMPGGGSMASILTLGYDPKLGRFVGTFIASVMTRLWPYLGSLDESGKVLTLDSEGPDFTTGEMAKFQDIVEIIDEDRWVLTSRFQDAEGRWHEFMKADHRRA